MLLTLPKAGPLFPFMGSLTAHARATEFYRLRHLIGAEHISLHIYRYHMADWCVEVGLPMRYVQVDVGPQFPGGGSSPTPRIPRVVASTPLTWRRRNQGERKVINGEDLVA